MCLFEDWLRELLVSGIMTNLSSAFDAVNRGSITTDGRTSARSRVSTH